MARCKSESQEAYNREDHAAAKDLSNQRKNHKQKMEQLNKEASNWIYHGQCYNPSPLYLMRMLIFSIENNRVSWLCVMFVWNTNSVIQNRKPGEIDLHGLYVKEAIAYTDTALKEAKLRGDSELRFIVGTCRSRKVSH